MPVIRLGDLTTFTGDTSGSWLVMNDSTNTVTYKVQKEQLMSGSFFGSASFADYALSASYAVSSSYSITASYAANAIASASNALTKTGSVVELGGYMYRNTYVTGTLEDSVDFTFTQSGSSILTGSAISGIYCLFTDSLGRIYVGSADCESYKGVTVGRGLFRIFQDGTLDTSFNTGVGFGPIRTAVENYVGQIRGIIEDPSTGKIYVAGIFDTYSGSYVGRGIVRLNQDGTIDTSFNTGVGFTGTNNTYGPYANSIDLTSNGKIVVGGAWTGYSGSSVGWSLCRLNTDGTYDTTFNVGNGVSVYGSGVGTQVQNVKVEPGTDKVYFTGQLNNYSGSTGYKGIIRLNPDGTIDQTFNAKPGLDTYQLLSSPYPSGWTTSLGSSNIILDSNLNIYLVGFFNSFNTTGSNGIIKLKNDGSIDTSFNYGSGFFSRGNQYSANGIGFSSFRAYLDQYDRLYFFGSAGTYSGSVISGSARILPNGTIDSTFKGNDGLITYQDYTVTKDKKSIVLAGLFNSATVVGRGYGGTPTDSRLIKVNISDPELIFNKTQLSYASDYSQFYTSRSLVDKEYVDNVTASYALTASYVDAANVVGLNLSRIASGSATASITPGLFNVNTNTNIQGDLTASNALFTGTITAQRLVTQVITSSTEFITGSTMFGSFLTDTHQFTGSVSVTGSLLATSSWAVRAVSASMVSSASFLNLIDTPKQYSGYSGSVLVVSSSELGLTFAQTALFDILDFGAKNFTELLDAPDSYLGQADKILVVSSSETGLQFRGTSVINSSDFGAQTFTELTDVPASYLGQADRVLVVSSSETGLQFRGTSVIDSSDFGVKTFVELTDAPDNYIAKSGFLVAVSGSETGLEFVPTASFSSTDLGYKQFIDLTDTPSTYSGKAGFLVSVSGSENALEFVPTASFDSSSFGYKQFIELTDTPSTYSGKGGFVVAVSGSQNALEFIPTASFDSSSFGYKQFIELTDTPSTYSGKEGFLVSVSSSANALEFVPTASLTGFFPIGMQDMYVGAEGFYPTFVSGCAPMATSYIPPATVRSLDFDAVTEENAQYTLSLPRNWDNSPIQTKIYWTVSGSESGSVVWAVKAAAYSNAFSLTASFSTEYIVSSSITGSVLNTTPYTAYITPSGSIQTGSLIIINVARKPDNANDNLSIDAKMIGMSIKYATNRATAE